MRLVWLVGTLILLAGCTQSQPSPVASEPAPATPVEDHNFSLPPPEKWGAVPVYWEGNLGERLIFCDPAGAQCIDEETTPGDTDYEYDQPGAWLRGATLNLTWDANGRLNQELGLGLMVMGTCSDCPTDLIEEVEGHSPLVIQTPYLDLALDEDRIVHAYVWNASGSRGVASGYSYVTQDQTFNLAGELRIEPASGEAS